MRLSFGRNWYKARFSLRRYHRFVRALAAWPFFSNPVCLLNGSQDCPRWWQTPRIGNPSNRFRRIKSRKRIRPSADCALRKQFIEVPATRAVRNGFYSLPRPLVCRKHGGNNARSAA